MKRLIVVVVLLVVAGGGAYYYVNYGTPKEKPQVVKATVSQGDVTDTVQATGTLEALRTVQVGSQVSGTVSKLYVDYNSIVHAGQLLAELDPSLLQVQVDLQQANVERQKGEIASQQVQLEDAQKQQARAQAMFDKGLATQADLDQAVLSTKTHATALDAANKQLVTNEASLDQAKLNVSYTKIYSPVDGVVIQRVVDQGQTVQSSMTTPQFFTLATDLRSLKLTASVDEADIGKIQRGMQVSFTVEAFPRDTFEGQVDAVRLNATTTNNVVTYPVWINAPNDQLKLKPSMTATVHIIVSTAHNVTRVPNTALRFRPTSDMFTALGLTPPPPQQGRAAGAGAGGAGADAGAAAATPGAPGQQGQGGQGQGQGRRRQQTDAGAATPGGAPAAQGQTAQQGQGQNRAGQAGQGGRGGPGAGQAQGQGFGRGFGGQFANMTPEERQKLREQFAARGGRGAGAGAGAGANGGGRRGANPPSAPTAISTSSPLQGDKIDDLFTPVQQRNTFGSVWTWDENAKKLDTKRVVVGITDGQFSQIVSGDIKPGDEVVTNIVVPVSSAQRQQQQNSIFNQGRGGPGGFGPGGFGPGGPGGGFGGGGGGGGGNRGGGR